MKKIALIVLLAFTLFGAQLQEAQRLFRIGDEKAAIEILTKSCDSGLLDSCIMLGNFYFSNDKLKYENAVKLYQKACEGGNLLGCDRLASAYYEGRGVKHLTQGSRAGRQAVWGTGYNPGAHGLRAGLF